MEWGLVRGRVLEFRTQRRRRQRLAVRGGGLPRLCLRRSAEFQATAQPTPAGPARIKKQVDLKCVRAHGDLDMVNVTEHTKV